MLTLAAAVGALALGRAAFGGEVPPSAWPIAGVYVLFALAFGWTVFFRNPLASGGSTGGRGGVRTPDLHAP
jgi:hypothetical protein